MRNLPPAVALIVLLVLLAPAYGQNLPGLSPIDAKQEIVDYRDSEILAIGNAGEDETGAPRPEIEVFVGGGYGSDSLGPDLSLLAGINIASPAKGRWRFVSSGHLQFGESDGEDILAGQLTLGSRFRLFPRAYLGTGLQISTLTLPEQVLPSGFVAHALALSPRLEAGYELGFSRISVYWTLPDTTTLEQWSVGGGLRLFKGPRGGFYADAKWLSREPPPGATVPNDGAEFFLAWVPWKWN